MNNRNYYGVSGVNAYGVCDDYEKIMNSKRFIGDFRCKSFKSFDEAKAWAENRFDDLQTGYFGDYTISEIRKLNWIYYRKEQ